MRIDLTKSVLSRIKKYVNQRIFPNRNYKLDKQIIIDVFKHDLEGKEIKNMLDGLKIRVPCNETGFASLEPIIEDIFRFTNEYTCAFKLLFIDAIDNCPPDKYPSDCECLINLANLIRNPTMRYLKEIGSNLKMIFDFG